MRLSVPRLSVPWLQIAGLFVLFSKDSVVLQDEDFETPMQPITIMRNALGKEEGGSGVPIDREAYMKSVNYWRHRVPVLERD